MIIKNRSCRCRVRCSLLPLLAGYTNQMEIEGLDGSTIELKHDGSKIVFGRGLGFNTKDRTVSRRHVLFQFGKTENQTEPRVSFQVIGKNPLWLRSGDAGGEIKVFRNLEKGEVAAGDLFCISSQSPVWFNLKGIEVAEEKDFNGSKKFCGNSESIDFSQIDPVKEFGFLVIGHEFDCYPKKIMHDVKNWDWFLEEPKQENEDDDESNKKKRGGSGRRKRRKGGGHDEDDDWTGESEEDKESVAKIRKIERSKYLTRSKSKNHSHKKIAKIDSWLSVTMSSSEEDNADDDDDETLGGFIVNDNGDEEQAGESNDDEEEEDEFIDDENDEDELDD